MDAVLTGSETMARAAELAGARLAPIFPITPQTQVIETLSQGRKVIALRANSEYNVMAMASGAAWAGVRVFTVTSSQGLVMMSEMMWEVAGNRLPVVMGVFNRALKGPGWNLGTQQNDCLMMRDTGWLMFFCETAQEVLDFTLLAYRIGEAYHFPVMVVGDGFYLSHTSEIVSLPDEASVRRFLPPEPPREGLPSFNAPAAYGPLTNAEVHFAFYQRLHEEMEGLADGPLDEAFAEFRDLFGREHDLIERHNVERAEIVIVATTTIAGTVRALLQAEPERYRHVGLVKLCGVRPFPGRKLAEALGHAGKIVVIDRNLSPCLGGIIASEVSAELQRFGISPLPWIYSVVAGLGGLPVSREMIARLIERVEHSSRPEHVMFLR